MAAGATAFGCWAYDKASMGYAYIQLGAAATEQLYMQGLQGVVELELTLKPLSSVGELRGALTPVGKAPTLPGYQQQHKRFSLIAHPPGHPRSKTSEEDVSRPEPVSTLRHVHVLPPLHLFALALGTTSTLCCTKSRTETKYFPRVGAGKPWTLDDAAVQGLMETRRALSAEDDADAGREEAPPE